MASLPSGRMLYRNIQTAATVVFCSQIHGRNPCSGEDMMLLPLAYVLEDRASEVSGYAVRAGGPPAGFAVDP
jgi:hypothetical protein